MILKTSYKMKPPISVRPALSVLSSIGCVGFWPLSEGSGVRVFDLSGGRHEGIVTGDSPWIQSTYGHALKFEGDDEIDITGVYVADVATILMRLKIDSVILAQMILDGRDGEDDNCQIYHRNTSQIEIWDTVAICVASTAGLNNEWHDWAFIYNGVGKAPYIYLDAVRVETDVVNQNTADVFENRLEFGCKNDETSYFEGGLARLIIFNRALCSSEISRLHYQPFYMFDREAKLELGLVMTKKNDLHS